MSQYIRVTSPSVIRRLRGFGGVAYCVDYNTPKAVTVQNARHFYSKGMDLETLCSEGRVWIVMGMPSRRAARLRVAREIKRQVKQNAKGSAISDEEWQEDFNNAFIPSDG